MTVKPRSQLSASTLTLTKKTVPTQLEGFECFRNRKMSLTVWIGDSGLVSKDYECIRAVLYARMAGVPATVIYRRNPMLSSHEYPFFCCSCITLTNTNDIISFLRMQNYSLEFHLSPTQCSEAYALENYVTYTMKPVLEYVYWLESRNYEEFTSLWHLKAMPVPFNYLYSWSRRKHAQEFVNMRFPLENGAESLRTTIYNNASEILATLSRRLGVSLFFYGDKPTTLDSTVYAFVAPLVYINFPSNELREQLNSWPNLIKFVRRINKLYFPEVPFESKFIKDANRSVDYSESASFSSKVYATIFASLFLFGFAVSKNLINVRAIKSVVGMN